MKLLLDHNLPRRLRASLPGHEVKTTREVRWDKLQNGLLLQAASGAGFDAFISIDKKLEHEQNLAQLPLPVVVLDALSNALPALLPFVPALQKLLATSVPRGLYIVESGGTVHFLTMPRQGT